MKKIKLIVLFICLFIPLGFAGCENTKQKTLSVPQNFNVEANGIISFEDVKGASYYVVSIDDVCFNVFPNADENNQIERVDNLIKYNGSRIFKLGKSYDVKVKAVGKDKSGEFTAVKSYTHALSIDKPQNIGFVGNVLTWDAVNHASYYVIKVISPHDIIEDDSASNVANLKLTEYNFSSNRFDFTSLLTIPGEYKFYINAMSLENNRLNSGFTSKTIYNHRVELKTPILADVHTEQRYNPSTNITENDFHVLIVADEYANALQIKVNDNVKTVYLNGDDYNVVRESENNYDSITNVFNINLSTLFDGVLALNKISQFEVSAQAIFYGETESLFYKNSNFSNTKMQQSLEKLPTPEIVLEQNNITKDYFIKWEISDLTDVASFMVYLGMEDGVQIIPVEKTATNMILPTDFVSASVQAIGNGKSFNSNMSLTISNFNNVVNEEIECVVAREGNEYYISWNQIANANYVVELDDKVFVLNSGSETKINISENKTELYNFVVTIIKDGQVPVRHVFDAKTIKKQLKTPTSLYFNNSSPYVLHFNGSDNAMGYYVYLNGNKIDKLFTTTTIDLSRYITNGSYNVCVEAVAEYYSIFKNSAKSSTTVVSHQQVLDTPEYVYDSETNSPVTKIVEGNQTKYKLKFKGVPYADRYEILINLVSDIDFDKSAGVHTFDITHLINGAGRYEIKVRALPAENVSNIKPSPYAILDKQNSIIITEQLEPVQNLKIETVNERHTLSFDIDSKADKYLVRVVKMNDENYLSYLEQLNLSNVIETIGACDITEHVKQEGVYYIYVTAIGRDLYANSDESKAYIILEKVQTLATPQIVKYGNVNENELYVYWIGDKNADYFLVNVIDQYDHKFEIKVLNNQGNKELVNAVECFKANINDAISIQGDYKIEIKAAIDTGIENVKEYLNSPYCKQDTFKYERKLKQDFIRDKFFYNGTEYNYLIEDVKQLRDALWYNYLYRIDESYMMPIMLNPQTLQDGVTKESVKNMLIRFANNATALGIYNFSQDDTWNATQQHSEHNMLNVMVKILLNLYPELHELKGLSVYKISDTIFEIEYYNGLEREKVNNPYTEFAVNAESNFDYLESSSRRDKTIAFALDLQTETMNVTTTEQLLHAVQYGKRPVFVGDCAVAEEVFNNAKEVLRSIIRVNMTDLEKTTAIFDWLSHAISYNYKSSYYINDQQQGELSTNMSVYGVRKEYYLEGVFLGLTNSNRGGGDGEFYLGNKAGTSDSYSKAFTLLCAIEGISTRKVNGTYTINTHNPIRHAWNKVCLQVTDNAEKQWYAVDLMFSNITSTNITYSYETASHLFYLVDEVNEQNSLVRNSFNDIGLMANNSLTSVDVLINVNDPTYGKTEYACGSNYNYYKYAPLKIAKDDISGIMEVKQNANYTKHFENNIGYNEYSTSGLGPMQRYIINNLLKAYIELKTFNKERVAIEFRFKHSDNNEKGSISELNKVINNFNDALIKDGTNKNLAIDLSGSVHLEADGYSTYIIVVKLSE